MPDRHVYNDPSIAGEASGVLMGGNGYIPWPQLTAITSAFAAASCGAYLARLTDGTRKLFVGTAAGLYRLDSSTTITDVTRVSGAYNVPADDQWSFDQFGTDLIAVQQGDAPQVIDVDSGTNFAALAGSPPTAGGVRVRGSQVFLYRLVDFPSRLAWSGRGDSEYWTFGQRDSDKQDFEDGGTVVGLTKLDPGLVFQDGMIRRITPIATRAVNRFDVLERDRGLAAPGSLVEYGYTSFYLSEEGFFRTEASGTSMPIGVNEVDDWFHDNINSDRMYATVGAADPATHHIYWLFPSAGTTSLVLDHIICYDIMQKAWTHAEVSASTIFTGATLGYNMDTLDTLLTSLGVTLDTAGFSLDAPFLRGGTLTLAAIDSSHKLAFFSGSAMAATIETGDFQPIIGRRAFVNGVTPITDNTAAQIRVGAKEAISGSLTYNSAQTVNARGFVCPRVGGRIHRVRLSHAAGDTWTHSRGVEVNAVDDGEI
jgi:hypothetical protein